MMNLDMLKKYNISWNVKQIAKMVNNGTLTFDNAVQRGYLWDRKRASLLIHSLIAGYPVPPFYAVKGDDGKYDMLDGKQRMTTIKRFYNGEFALADIPPITYTIDGQEMEMPITDCKYENLPEDVRDQLDSVSLLVYFFSGITEEEVSEMFFRLNNGVAVNSALTTRVKALSKGQIKQLGQHRLFERALTKKALEMYTNEDIVIKALYVYSGADNLETKNIRKWISETEIDNDMVSGLHGVLSRLDDAAGLIEKEDKKLVKKILTKTHMLSLIPMINQSREDKIKDADLVEWLKRFYGSDKTSVSSKYNEASGRGSSRKDAVTTRFSELERSYNKMFHPEKLKSDKADKK